MVELVVRVVGVLDWSILAYFVLVNAAQAVLLASAWRALRDFKRGQLGPVPRRLDSPFTPRITVVVPAYNEASVVTQTVTSALAIDYPDLEVVVVNDGSTDETLERLVERYELCAIRKLTAHPEHAADVRTVFASEVHPGLFVVDKANGGKADALNAAIAHASGALVCAIDADTVIEPNALELLVQPFLDDQRTIAAGGTIRVANGCHLEHARVVARRSPRNWLAAIQAVEYPRAFLFGRLGWNRLGGNVIISGAFGLFDRALILEAGGYAEDTVGEDMELVLRLRRLAYEQGRDHRVFFVPDPVAWTEAPETVRTLARQRNRWHRGLADVLRRHRDLIGRRRYGAMGLVVLPFYLVFELLAPVIEAIGLLALAFGLGIGAVDLEFAALFGLLAYGVGLVLALGALAMERHIDAAGLAPAERARQVAWVFAEQLGYRQMTVVWRLWGLAGDLRGDRQWGQQVRRGFSEAPPAGELHQRAS